MIAKRYPGEVMEFFCESKKIIQKEIPSFSDEHKNKIQYRECEFVLHIQMKKGRFIINIECFLECNPKAPGQNYTERIFDQRRSKGFNDNMCSR